MLHLPALPTFMDWHWLLLTVAAFLAGLLNAVAGGGRYDNLVEQFSGPARPAGRPRLGWVGS